MGLFNTQVVRTRAEAILKKPGNPFCSKSGGWRYICARKRRKGKNAGNRYARKIPGFYREECLYLPSEFTTKLINKKKVILVPEPNYEDKDRYGRLLRYVYLDDGTFVNKKIVEEGYANAYRRYKISKLDEFIKAENDAREHRRGLWGSIEGLRQFEAK